MDAIIRLLEVSHINKSENNYSEIATAVVKTGSLFVNTIIILKNWAEKKSNYVYIFFKKINKWLSTSYAAVAISLLWVELSLSFFGGK